MISSKIINHVKYYHNFSNAALLDTFSSGQLQLLISEGSLEAGAVGDEGSLVVRGSNNPKGEYNCYKCNAVYSDCGAHLLFQVITVLNIVRVLTMSSSLCSIT